MSHLESLESLQVAIETLYAQAPPSFPSASPSLPAAGTPARLLQNFALRKDPPCWTTLEAVLIDIYGDEPVFDTATVLVGDAGVARVLKALQKTVVKREEEDSVGYWCMRLEEVVL